MALPQRGLGRGLDALFKNNKAVVASSETDASAHNNIDNVLDSVVLELENAYANLNQPRKIFEQAPLEELAQSIKQQGILQPILVREKAHEGKQYEIIAGERRWRAAAMAGLTTIPAIIKDLTDQEAFAVALIENLQRENLNPMEEACAIQELKTLFALSQEELAASLGKSRSAIANILRLVTLPEIIQANIQAGLLSAGHARALLSITDETDQETVRMRCVDGGLTVRQLETIAAYWKETGTLPAEFFGTPAGIDNTCINNDDAVPVFPVLSGSVNPARKLPELVALQEQLAGLVDGKVVVLGKKEKGKIVFSYTSLDELASVLNALGVDIAQQALFTQE